jgi:hypothetical protein
MDKVKVGDIYWDCSYHPVLCTESVRVKRHFRTVDYDVAGVSLFDGSRPRSCSVHHCGVTKLKLVQIQWLILHREDFLSAEAQWRNGEVEAYKPLLKEWDRLEWGERFEDALERDWYSWRKIFNRFWWKSILRRFRRASR